MNQRRYGTTLTRDSMCGVQISICRISLYLTQRLLSLHASCNAIDTENSSSGISEKGAQKSWVSVHTLKHLLYAHAVPVPVSFVILNAKSSHLSHVSSPVYCAWCHAIVICFLVPSVRARG